ncbi:sulfurtransferase TusA [Nitrincola iocasae]|jgi:tRNA 2-thiouridine synthesizing protein A|uniref:Sulfur carrier protein TusA n=1 Tax=Nitrincola iocasae TaxID=2614693 RepID=A0A5J6LEJ3_9GAMM|nr:sulfurtransferase TusA [Nitrincola iocasae]QEW07030.1 sulfurtransferase TusA [Nitrincola iocasae]
MNQPVSDMTLDTSGLLCPEPVMLLHKKVRELTPGQVLFVKATDPSTQRDIPRFCAFLGYELIEQLQQEDGYEYYIRKGAE